MIGHVFQLSLLFFSMAICAQAADVSGVVQDAGSRQTMEGANVYFDRSAYGTVTDKHGRFRIGIPNHLPDTLIVSFIGFHPARIAVSHPSDVQSPLYIDLYRKVLMLDGLSVESERYHEEIRAMKMEPGALRMDLQELRTVPYALFADVNRSLEFLPGVMSRNDLTNELYVRGGNTDQNLVMLEGVPVYYPFHVFGLASAFNPDLVGEIHFSPGGFSTQYGNRLSSVLNVRSHVPHKTLELSADISLIAADLTASGRYKNMLNWLISGRKSYYDLLFKKTKNGIPYSFYDFFSKVSFSPDADNSISMMLFSFRDVFTDYTESDNRLYSTVETDSFPPPYITYTLIRERNYSWNNRLAAMNWEHRWPVDVYSCLKVYLSRAANDFWGELTSDFPHGVPPEYESGKKEIQERDKKQGIHVHNNIMDRSAALDLVWNHYRKISVKAGLLYSSFATDYGWGTHFVPMTPLLDYRDHIKLYFDHAGDYFDYDRIFFQSCGYGEAHFDISPNWQLRAGARFVKWNTQSKAYAEPRINLRCSFNNNWSTSVAVGRYTQGLATALEDGLVCFLRLYFSLDDSLELETADHIIWGIDYQDGRDKQFSLNAYVKNYRDLLRSAAPGPQFVQHNGRTLGLELSAKTAFCGWKSRAAFALSRSYHLENREKIDTNWDQRYRLDLFASRIISKRWKLSWAWVLHSGVPYNPDHYITAVRKIGYDDNGRVDLDREVYDPRYMTIPRGQIREAWYHRLDISLAREFHFSTWHLDVYFSIQNVYARKNALYYQSSGISSKTENGEHFDYRIKNRPKWLPPIPTIGIRAVM